MIPNQEAPTPDTGSLKPEDVRRPDLAGLRRQAAFARTLLDHYDRLVPSSDASLAVVDQLVEDLTQLGVLTIEAAAALKRERRSR